MGTAQTLRTSRFPTTEPSVNISGSKWAPHMYEVEVGMKFVRCNFWSHTFSSCCLCTGNLQTCAYMMNKDWIIEIVNAGNIHCYGKPLRKLLCFSSVIAANSVIYTKALYSRAVQYYYRATHTMNILWLFVWSPKISRLHYSSGYWKYNALHHSSGHGHWAAVLYIKLKLTVMMALNLSYALTIRLPD